MKLQKFSKYLTSASLLLVVLFGYQNCSQTHFSSDLDGAVLKTEAISGDGRAAGDDGQALPGDGDQAAPPADGSQPVPPADGSVGATPTPSPGSSPVATPAPTATPVVGNPNANPNSNANSNPNAGSEDKKGGASDSTMPPQAGGNGNGKDKDKKDSSVDTSDLVECQMLHPNKKVVLSYELFVQHGNSSSVRVCMSTNACLKLINEFAVQHSCSLDGSAPMSQDDVGRQCSEIFPGSKGTCHNAAVLTDAQVSELLKKLTSQ